MPLSSRFLRQCSARLAVVALCCTATLSHATVDDSHGFAMEAAMPFVEQGFIVREDYWNGEVKSGQKLMIKHQMFKGNEYAFWLGSANEDVVFELKVLDEKGKEITIDSKSSAMFSSVRVNPPKTGTYSIVFSVTSKKEVGLFWALAYGYR
ncbi:MAG: hypothetical protein NTV80_11310 [Verrucomicrobia bacterium]|nr:hypothetical protein [Verrucomicrobiota bacterium]